jgi:hypothetical protein
MAFFFKKKKRAEAQEKKDYTTTIRGNTSEDEMGIEEQTFILQKLGKRKLISHCYKIIILL